MSRDFYCFRCGQLINVADDFPNRTIPCPHCGEQMPPPNYVPQSTMRRVEPSEPIPSPFTIGELFSDAWNIGTKCWRPFLIMGGIIGGFNLIVSVCMLICMLFMFLFLPIVAGNKPQPEMVLLIQFIACTAIFVLSLITAWLYGGGIAYSLAIIRGEQPRVSILFSGTKYFWGILPFIIASVVVPLVVPLMIVLWLSCFFVVDQRLGAVESVKRLWQFVRIQGGTVLGAVLLIAVVTIAVNSVPVAGIFLSVPVVFCLYTVLYLKITGQKHGLSP
jgi:hypothetical protein